MSDPKATTLAVLEELLAGLHARDFAVRLWDGTEWPAETPEPRWTLVLAHHGSLRALLLPPTQVAMGEAYVYGDVDIEGDVRAVFGLADHLLARPLPRSTRFRLARRLLTLPRTRVPREGKRQPPEPRLRARRYSREYDRQAVTSHYDLPNELFPHFLGRTLLYTSAYFESPDEDLDTAQERKLDLICRKLRLREGERLLDVGCGWGTLAVWAAERHGVRVDAVTLSRPQAELGAARAAEAGVSDLVRIEARDYRDVTEWGAYDKVASIEMFEHVAPHQLRDYFAHLHRLLKPGGAMLNQGICRRIDFDVVKRRGTSFIERWVWPNCVVVPVSEALRAAELAGFEVRDVENMRDHYVLTLTHWSRNVEAAREEITAILDEEGYRLFRLWTAGAAYGNARGHVGVHQVLLAKPDDGVSGLPLRRDREQEPEPAAVA